jgi:hypothetical protein
VDDVAGPADDVPVGHGQRVGAPRRERGAVERGDVDRVAGQPVGVVHGPDQPRPGHARDLSVADLQEPRRGVADRHVQQACSAGVEVDLVQASAREGARDHPPVVDADLVHAVVARAVHLELDVGQHLGGIVTVERDHPRPLVGGDLGADGDHVVGDVEGEHRPAGGEALGGDVG